MAILIEALESFLLDQPSSSNLDISYSNFGTSPNLLLLSS